MVFKTINSYPSRESLVTPSHKQYTGHDLTVQAVTGTCIVPRRNKENYFVYIQKESHVFIIVDHVKVTRYEHLVSVLINIGHICLGIPFRLAVSPSGMAQHFMPSFS